MPTSKFHIRQLLLKIDARRLRQKSQLKCIDYVRPRLNKYELECKKCGCNEFYVFDDQSSSFVIYCPFHNA